MRTKRSKDVPHPSLRPDRSLNARPFLLFAAIATISAFIITFFVYREMDRPGFPGDRLM
ncbi:MAG: hypothetical protein ACOC0O_07685 [Spirochaetota bacterium]